MKSKLKIFIITIFLCFVISIIVLSILAERVMPIFSNYAISEIKNISTSIINDAINKEIYNFNDKMVNISRNSKDEIEMIDFNSVEVNKLLISVTEEVLKSLKDLERGNNDISLEKVKYEDKVFYEIPLGAFSKNMLLANLGPKLPIKLNVIGDVVSNIKTEVKEYGINNALIEVFINVTVSEKVVMPFISKTVDVNVDVPISLKIIHGNIPQYYGGIFSKNSGILSIPTE